VLGNDGLAFRRVEEIEIGLGELAGAVLVDVLVDQVASMLSLGYTTSNLSAPNSPPMPAASFSKVTSTSPVSRCVKVVVAPRPPPSSTDTLANSFFTNSRAPSSLPVFFKA
jgi:hypothetical protein